jgi:hypothetical protein
MPAVLRCRDGGDEAPAQRAEPGGCDPRRARRADISLIRENRSA